MKNKIWCKITISTEEQNVEVYPTETFAKVQEDRVYLIFIQNKKKGMTPFDVSREYDKLYPKAPVTSIRRAMTQLTKNRHLIMTDNKKNGIYNTPNHVWELNINPH